jgi:alkanesulfonate monooxygenase SsuD/methylene tetrahydromethanopterin reductase-like flavin-dependent oxidoreductase (luciferase family)
VSRDSPYPLGGDLPDRYRRNLEALSAVAMAAAATSRIRVGTGVLLAALRDPIVTAKALATIDRQSGGRVAVGVGYGWNREEMLDHRVNPATRRARTREHVLAMRNLWEREIAGYDGRFVSTARPGRGPSRRSARFRCSSAGTTSGSSVSTVSSLGLITVTRASVEHGCHAPPMKCSSG